MTSPTFRLFARPSFLEGLARLLDFGGTLNEYNYSDSPAEADFLAIQSDWEAVGLDMTWAIEEFEETYQEQIDG